MVQVIPAIIPNSLEEIEKKVSLVNSLPKNTVKKVQIDFLDGLYASTITWPFNVLPRDTNQVDFVDLGRLPFTEEFILEADLMIKRPEDFVDDFIKIGIKSFIFHIGSTEYLGKCLELARKSGSKVGVAIKPKDDNNILYDVLHQYPEQVDFVQFMGNDDIGKHGVELDRKVLKKISDFHTEFPYIPVQIDIGVNRKTAPELIRAGATGLVSGSAVFGSENIKENIEKLLDI